MCIFFLLLCSLLINQDFSINQHYGTVFMNNDQISKPFQGGFNKPKIQWVDWDEDGDDDLFLLDEDGYIKYYNNQLPDDLVLISTNYFNFPRISWFYIGDFDNDFEYEIVTQDPNNINQMIYYNFIDLNPIELGTVYDNLSNPVSSDPVMVPTFVDIDNDGDLDFFTGNMIGTITYYENVGSSNSLPEFELITTFWQDIYIVGPSNRHGASALNFIDIDNDSDYDLSWGDYYQQSLYIIKNEGSVDNPDMDNINVINQYPENSPVLSAGLNMPSFSDIDNDGDMDLFVTVLSGAYGYQLINNFLFFLNDEGEYIHITNEFIRTIDLFSDIYPELVDIDNDNDLDLFIGTDVELSSFPWSGKIKFFENGGDELDGEPLWALVDSEYLGGDVGDNLSLDFGDIDGDNDYDIVIGDFNGTVKLFRNIGNQNSAEFVYEEMIAGIDLSGYSVPKLVDIDNDSDLDLFVGEMSGTISFYENIGTSESYNFVLVTNQFEDISVASRSSIDFIDLDGDDDFDLFVGSQFDNVLVFSNIGNSQNPVFAPYDDIGFPSLGLNLAPCVYEENNMIRMLIGCSTGGAYSLEYEVCSLIGDFNNDFIIDVIDIIFLINSILGSSYDESECSLDINNDLVIDVLDVIVVVNIILEEM